MVWLRSADQVPKSGLLKEYKCAVSLKCDPVSEFPVFLQLCVVTTHEIRPVPSVIELSAVPFDPSEDGNLKLVV